MEANTTQSTTAFDLSIFANMPPTIPQRMLIHSAFFRISELSVFMGRSGFRAFYRIAGRVEEQRTPKDPASMRKDPD
jgi:hypothetical protein